MMDDEFKNMSSDVNISFFIEFLLWNGLLNLIDDNSADLGICRHQ